MALRILGSLALLVASALCGCGNLETIGLEQAAMYADTRTAAGDGFTSKSPQYAYDGEPVTLDFQPDPGATDYVIFTWPNGTSDVLGRQHLTPTGYRGVGVFKAGRQQRSNVIRATAYMMRGERDWYYDKDQKLWVYHLVKSDLPDWKVGEAQMEIICYRVDIDLTVGGAGKRVKDAVLTISRDDGSNTIRRLQPAAGTPALTLIGPDAGGRYQVRYTPTWKEVNRVGRPTSSLW